MSMLSFSRAINIEYKFIFEYYDRPLSFIGFVDNINYLFHFIDDENFFIAEMNIQEVEKLSENKNISDFLHFLIDENKVSIINFNYDLEETCYKDFDETFERYIPKNDSLIDYDILSERQIDADFRFESQLVFPIETEQLTVRILDNDNSNLYKFSVIENVMKYINDSFNFISKSDTNKELMMSPFTVGSFKVNFKLFNNPNLIEENIDFSSLIKIINELNTSDRALDLNLAENTLNSELLGSVDSLYEVLKREGIQLQFKDVNNLNLAELSGSPLIGHNLSVFKDKIKELNQEKLTSETIVVDGDIRSANVQRNSFSLVTVEKVITGRFDKNLRVELREKSTTFTKFPSSITATIKVEYKYNENDELISTTYTMMSFSQ
ncbi:hypothetical protein CNY62_02375 [Brochothrix thermosphacta]|uniref:Uncharacterized protein n=1 Tax=Brochothrix thermosphacta TaxID=2756 RepID=A0A291BW38_BROTH|nr:hypothetical protein [Brochothrix thermosphacta]ATF25330.1 hypothetical protein CNY62_02375 [Brochothrix thermosphacta]